MQAANDPLAQLLDAAKRVFDSKRLPPTPNDIIDPRQSRLSLEIHLFLAGRRWTDVAGQDHFKGKWLDRGQLQEIDLGNIGIAISNLGLAYYLPGLLSHFVVAGTYANSILGPTFYLNIVSRLQPDNPRAMNSHASCFAYGIEQKQFVCAALEAIRDRHGDEYQKFAEASHEYSDVARFSSSRAISKYWCLK